MHSVLRVYDPLMETVGLDEANLDVTNYLQTHNMTSELGKNYLAEQMRNEIFEKTGLTASCGISCNKMLAKICSDVKKPNG
jgi:nucleotidyltransferase/DNA polymerase involved in DNA repair